MFEEYTIGMTIDLLKDVISKLKLRYSNSTSGFSFGLSLIKDALGLILNWTSYSVGNIFSFLIELWPISFLIKLWPISLIKDYYNKKIEDVNNYTERVTNVAESNIIKITAISSIYQGLQISALSLAVSSDYSIIYVPLVVLSSTFLYLVGIKYGFKSIKNKINVTNS